MNEIYIIDGKKFRVGLINKDDFLQKNPTAELFVEEEVMGPEVEGKPEVAVEEVAPAVTGDTESQLEDGSSESPESKYKTPLTRDQKVALQNNNFMKQMLKEKNQTQERLKELITERENLKATETKETIEPMQQGFVDSITNVTADNSKVAIATNYFNLGQGIGDQDGVLKPKVVRPQRFKKLPDGRDSGTPEYVNSYETDLKNSLGEEKYKEYIDLRDNAERSNNGAITADLIEDVFKIKNVPTDVVLSTVQSEKYSAAESYINEKDLNEEEQNALNAYLPGDKQFKDDVINSNIQRKKDAIDYEALTGKPLRETQIVNGRTYTYGTKESMKEAIGSQSKRLEATHKDIVSDHENLLEVDLKNYEKEIADLDKNLEQRRLGIINSKPTTQEELDTLNLEINAFDAEVEKRNVFANQGIASLKDKQTELRERSNVLTSLIEETGITKTANRAIQKSYALDDQFSLVMETAFLGSGAMLGASILKGIGDTVQFVDKAMFQREGSEDLIDESGMKMLRDIKGAAVNYNQELRKKKADTQPETLGEDDNGYWGRMLVDNSPSILTAIATMGAGSLGAAGARAAANAATAVFFTMESGGQMADLEIQQKTAPKTILALEEELEIAKGDFDIDRIKKEIADQRNILNKSQWEKSLNSVLYGGIAAGAERFGTLGFIKNFQKYSKAIGYKQFRQIANIGMSRALSKSLGAIGGIGVGVVIEELEETMTLIGQNLMDQAVLNVDKNTFEGLDKEFFRNVAISSLAISGTAASQNIYSAVSQEFSNRAEIRKEGKLRGEVLDIQRQLDKGGLTRDARNLLEKSKKKVLKELALDNTKKVLKISDLTAEEFESITEANRELRNIQKEANAIGQSGDVSTWSNSELERLKTEYENVLSERAKVFDNKNKEILDLFKGQTSNEVEAVNSYGLYNFAKGIAKNQNGVNQVEFEDRKSLKDYLKTNNYSEIFTEKVLKGYDEGANAFNQTGSNDIFLFKDNVTTNISTGGRISGRIAAMAPLHELGHIQTREAGIIKDGEVAGDAVSMIKGIKEKVSNLFNQKSITQKQYNAFKLRVAQYTDTDGKVDADELIQAVADFTNIGVLPKSAFNGVYEIKTYVNSVMQHINGDASMYFQLDKSDDVFNFVSSWTEKAKEMIQLPASKEDKIEEGKESRSTVLEAINELVPAEVKTKEEFQNPKVFNPIYKSLINEGGAINNYIRSRTTSVREAEKAIESVSDRLLNFDPEATRKAGETVGAEAFGEFIFANTNFGKMVAKKALFKEGEIAKQETPLDSPEATTQLADEVSINETKVKSTTSKLRRVLGIKQGDAIYDLAKEVSSEILSGDLPGKKVKTAINKEARKSKLRKAVSDLMGTEKAIDEQFLNKNILEILKALPASDLVKLEREAKVKVLAEQGPRLNVKDAREAVNKGLLPKDTNLQSGPKVSSKLPTTLEQAKEFFTQKRKAGLVNVVTEMLVKDAAPEVTKDKMEPAKRAKVLSEIDRAPTLKFSKGNLTKEQLNLVKQQQGEIFQRFVSSDRSVKSMRLILSDVLEDAGVSDETISKYAQELTSPAKKFIVDLKKQLVTESDFGEVTNEQIEQALSAITLKSLLGIDVNPGGAFDVTEYLNKFRKLQHEYQLEQIKKLGNLDGIISILKFHKDYHTSAGKIGDGRYQGYAGSLDWFKATNEALKDKKIEIKYKETGTGVVPVNVTINGVEQFKNQAELKAKIKTFSQSNNLKRETVEAEYDARKEEAGEGFDAMVDYLGFISSKGDKLQFGMSLMALKSNMSALGKRVAYVKYFYNGKSDSATVFEHMLPSLYTLKEMVKNFYEGGVDLEALKESQQVAMIPRDMDKRINIVHQASMPSWFKLGMSPLTRYFNALTKGYKNMFALESIGGKDKGVVYGEDHLALNNSVLKASKSNNNILPNELKLKGDFINDNVLNEMSDIDSESRIEEGKFSKALDLNKDFNDIIENKTGIASNKTYARVKAQVAGASKGRFNFFIPPSAEDFVGLLYSTLGKGDIGDAQMAWYKAHLLNPFARAMENLANDRANMMQDFRGLKKSLKIVPKNLRKKIKDSNFTQEQAVRAYIWDQQGMEIPGLSQKDQQALVDFVNEDANLTTFADQLIAINKGDAYAAPDAGWVAGNIGTDFIKALNTTKRSKYLEVWQQNADQIFSEANLNKLEAAYGANYREAMVDMLKRMRTGRNTSSGSDRLAARFTDWLTNSVGAIMFFNTRSAVLQTISAVNFINFSDNNVLKAGAAFANQPQYWSDFKKLFNSPFLLDRRSGLKLNVNEADIASMAKGPGNGARNVIAGILKAGFLPTQLADSFAIASGGASFYRNRIKALQKEGLTEAEAEEQAFRDFREIAEESQQSSRPDKISQQQAGPLGRVVLAFANTPAQYARLIKKAASDLKNGRGDAKTNISKIIYYGVAQNLLFSALQQALFAIAFDDDEEEEKKNEKYFNIVNGMSDSILRGIGIGGAIVSVVKNTAIRLAKEADKKSPKYQDAVVKGILQISPPISSKVGKLQSAGRSYSWNQEEMRTRGWSIDNPAYLANANVISALTNVPLDRAIKKITNIVDAGNEDIEYYKRVALALGWSAWELGIDKKEGKVAPPKTDMDKLYDLTKKQQIDSLTSLGISKKQIKALKLEEDRVNAILNPKSIKQIKVSKRDSLFGLNKKDQIQALEKLGLTKKEIRALRLESDRVEAIINQQKEKVE